MLEIDPKTHFIKVWGKPEEHFGRTLTLGGHTLTLGGRAKTGNDLKMDKTPSIYMSNEPG